MYKTISQFCENVGFLEVNESQRSPIQFQKAKGLTMKVETTINPKTKKMKHELNVFQRRKSREGPQIESFSTNALEIVVVILYPLASYFENSAWQICGTNKSSAGMLFA